MRSQDPQIPPTGSNNDYLEIRKDFLIVICSKTVMPSIQIHDNHNIKASPAQLGP